MAKRQTKADQDAFLCEVLTALVDLEAGMATAEPASCRACRQTIRLDGNTFVCRCEGCPTVDPRDFGRLLAAVPAARNYLRTPRQTRVLPDTVPYEDDALRLADAFASPGSAGHKRSPG